MLNKTLQWLEKATFSTTDLSGGSNGGLLSPDQAREFLRVALMESVLLRDLNIVTSNATKFEIPRINFSARILKKGTEATRLVDGKRVKPATGLVTLSTNLYKGEVPVSDEMFEDNIEKEGLADTIATQIAEAVGRDIEEFIIKGDTARDPAGADVAQADSEDFDLFDGMIKQMQTNLVTAQKLDLSTAPSYDDIFGLLLAALPSRYRRNYSALRFYVPTKHKDGYSQELGGRGTPLGDRVIIDGMQAGLAYRGIPVSEVPLMSGTDTINGSAIDYTKFIMLLHPMNFFLGFHRKVRMEKWRDPREGVTSFLPSVRFDGKFGDPDFGVLGYSIAL